MADLSRRSFLGALATLLAAPFLPNPDPKPAPPVPTDVEPLLSGKIVTHEHFIFFSTPLAEPHWTKDAFVYSAPAFKGPLRRVPPGIPYFEWSES